MDSPATGVLDGCSGDRWFGDGQEYRGVVGKMQQQRARKSTTQSEFSDGVVRASSPSTLSTRLIQTARARGIDRTGLVDLAGKNRTCAIHRSLGYVRCGQPQAQGANAHAAQTDRKQVQPAQTASGQHVATRRGIETNGQPQIGAKRNAASVNKPAAEGRAARRDCPRRHTGGSTKHDGQIHPIAGVHDERKGLIDA